MKISEAFALHLKNEIRAVNYSVNTMRCYQNTGRVAVKYFGDINIKKIDIEKVHDFYLYLTERVSKNTARRYITNFRFVIRTCRRYGIKTMNPDEIITPRGEKKVARFINEGEYKMFLAAASTPVRGYSKANLERNVLIIKVLHETGIRVGELCALNRDTIKDRQFVVVGKSKEPRVCFITHELEAEINSYLDKRTDGNCALFVSNQTGNRMTTHNVQEVFRHISKKSKIYNVTPHTLRHAYATRFLEKGVDIRIVAAMLGHQNITTTQNYTHITNCFLKMVYDKVNDPAFTPVFLLPRMS